MPAQYVKPTLQTTRATSWMPKAIAEAVQRPRMRFVPIKTEEQLDLQALHRVRERWVNATYRMVNQIRSLLLERGLTLPKADVCGSQLPRILEDAELRLSGSFRVLLAQLKIELEQLTARIEEMDQVIQKTAKENEACQRLTEIPESVGHRHGPDRCGGQRERISKRTKSGGLDGDRSGRVLPPAANRKLLGISKRGNKYLRTLFIQGARKRIAAATQASSRSQQLVSATAGACPPECGHRGFGQQLVRMAWAVLCKNQRYRTPVLAVSA